MKTKAKTRVSFSDVSIQQIKCGVRNSRDEMFHILGDSRGIKKALTASNVADDISGRGGGWSDGRQQGGAVPVCPCLDRRAWESLNKQGPSERCRMVGGGTSRGTDLLTISGYVSSCRPSPKTFKGGFVYLLCRQELGIW